MADVFQREFPKEPHEIAVMALVILLSRVDLHERARNKRKSLPPAEDTETFLQMIRGIYVLERDYPDPA